MLKGLWKGRGAGLRTVGGFWGGSRLTDGFPCWPPGGQIHRAVVVALPYCGRSRDLLQRICLPLSLQRGHTISCISTERNCPMWSNPPNWDRLKPGNLLINQTSGWSSSHLVKTDDVSRCFLPGVFIRWSGPMKTLFLDVNNREFCSFCSFYVSFSNRRQKDKVQRLDTLFISTGSVMHIRTHLHLDSFSQVTWMHHKPSTLGETGEVGETREAGLGPVSQSVTGGGWVGAEQGGVKLYIRVFYHSYVSESWLLVLYLMKRVYFDSSVRPVLSLPLFTVTKKNHIKSLFI